MKTLNFVLLVLVLVTSPLAWWLVPKWQKPPAASDLPPTVLQVELKDEDEAMKLARQVNELTLVSFDETRREPYTFTIACIDDEWVIPSHHNYPADGGSKVGSTAGSLLGIRLGRLVTEEPERFAELGVVAPEQVDKEKGHGIRVKMKYGRDKPVCDVVIGERVDGQWNRRYVRETGKNEVYEAELKLDLKTDFVEWVEQDLLKVSREDVRQVKVENYKIDEVRRVIVPVSETVLLREGKDADWEAVNTPAGKVVDQDKVRSLLWAFNRVRISGVRLLDKQNLRALSYYGFFQDANSGEIYGNEGCNHIITGDGLRYRIYFGEVASGEGHALSAGLGGEEKEPADGGKAAGDHRYVTVYLDYCEAFDQQLQAIADDPPPAKTPEPKAEEKAEEAKAAEEEPEKAKAEGKEAEETEPKQEPPKPETAADKRAARRKEMQAKAAEQRERFERFVFVVSDAVFKDLRPEEATLFKDEKPPEEEKKAENK